MKCDLRNTGYKTYRTILSCINLGMNMFSQKGHLSGCRVRRQRKQNRREVEGLDIAFYYFIFNLPVSHNR